MIIGFLDETSPQTTANTQRLWSYGYPTLVKNTTKFRANTFGFYSINGCSLLEFYEHSKKEDVCAFLQLIRHMNSDGDIIIILDNFSSHHATTIREFAEHHRIKLVFLPPYSPDLNPIEFIWKSIRRIISHTFIQDLNHLKQTIFDAFEDFSSSLSFARAWMIRFLGAIVVSKVRFLTIVMQSEGDEGGICVVAESCHQISKGIGLMASVIWFCFETL